MKASLAVCILAALLAVGSCLQCEVCTAQGNSCTGPMQTCASGQDTCVILLMEFMLVGVKNQTIAKACATSSECKTGSDSVNFGMGMKIRTSSACCMAEACNTITVTALLADTKPNGRTCPGCFTSSSEQCWDEIVDCTGAETHCVDATMTINLSGNPAQFVMKGCTSESVCAELKAGSSAFAEISANVITGQCRAASGAGGVAPGAAGLLLPALAELLLLKLLF
ncbi:phospholipase A2 inhibitor and Ly6/PLAUR domain-containing protein-like [Emydura macquarii macquarii]|uniref:phospholipase A2 inhibitor and Ly6/PLAUR domain-containing protein-like n=1 Tax=Emydura macquarii macquarii TaxID=1129001 RepID=UPI00352B7C3F